MIGKRNGTIHSKQRADGSHEWIAFLDGVQMTAPYIHHPGVALFKGRAVYSDWRELLHVEENSDGTVIHSVSDIDGFISTRRYDASGPEIILGAIDAASL
ncbi:hypothetical protein [Terriglobus roseus]|uniref:Uncharacterized protein n=1 Tax=Terriglobus roseus TaxID=392734 RepID=A0A1G7HL86_9BACT|nr:hypothetical protein [Terriglobus roseus]SDF01133.1 hypothetical protein SAMN05444167_1121 [Terriglobus roseus]